jgi:membrane protease YdiL (CAAX protease family)
MAIAGALLAIGSLTAAAFPDRLAGDATLLAWLALAGALLFAAGLVYTAIRQIGVRRFLPPERYRGPNVLILLALVFVVATLVNAPFGDDIVALIDGEGDLTLLGAAVILTSTPAALLGISWLFVHRPKALAGLPAFPGRDAGRAALTGLGWGVVAWIGATVLGLLSALVLEAIGIAPDRQTAEQAVELLEPWIVVPAVVLLAPIAEEVFFRGIVFNAWLREGGRTWAYVGSSVLFAAIHLSLVSLVPIIALGVALAWAYERTGTLVTPIVMHAVVNGLSVTIALLYRFGVIQLPG